MKKINREHYVSNKEFYQVMLRYRDDLEAADQASPPPIPSFAGDAILKIARNLSNKSNFFNYPFKEEMIGDGVENCIKYFNSFNPDKSTNPFSYFTRVIYNSFLQRIEKEKRALYVKYKETERFNMMSSLSVDDSEIIKSSEGSSDNASTFIRDFEEKRFKK